jgi:hypothetical protein
LRTAPRNAGPRRKQLEQIQREINTIRRDIGRLSVPPDP